jgi:hypothetical protein
MIHRLSFTDTIRCKGRTEGHTDILITPTQKPFVARIVGVFKKTDMLDYNDIFVPRYADAGGLAAPQLQ